MAREAHARRSGTPGDVTPDSASAGAGGPEADSPTGPLHTVPTPVRERPRGCPRGGRATLYLARVPCRKRGHRLASCHPGTSGDRTRRGTGQPACGARSRSPMHVGGTYESPPEPGSRKPRFLNGWAPPGQNAAPGPLIVTHAQEDWLPPSGYIPCIASLTTRLAAIGPRRHRGESGSIARSRFLPQKPRLHAAIIGRMSSRRATRAQLKRDGGANAITPSTGASISHPCVARS